LSNHRKGIQFIRDWTPYAESPSPRHHPGRDPTRFDSNAV
jgi:hypothetical protein